VVKSLCQLHKSCKCICKSCSKGNCTLTIGTPQSAAIDCDHCESFQQPGKRPDFIVLIVITSPPCWVVVEMKEQVSHPSVAVAQLQAGATTIERDARFKIPHFPQKLFPIILRIRGHVRAADYLNRPVVFLGQKINVYVQRCGLNLFAWLSSI
jgi:hypothetical protein